MQRKLVVGPRVRASRIIVLAEEGEMPHRLLVLDRTCNGNGGEDNKMIASVGNSLYTDPYSLQWVRFV